MNVEESLSVASSFVDFEPAPPTLQALILEYLATHRDVTFVDLEEDIPGFEGELTLRNSSERNTILWRGLSPSAVCALCTLERENKIAFDPVSHHVYRSRGRRIQLPVAKGKATPWRWLPAVIKIRA